MGDDEQQVTLEPNTDAGATRSAYVPALQVTNLSVTFKQKRRPPVRALRAVSFAAEAGEIVGIVGESGSGKTTLGRCIAGFIRPDEGEVVCLGGRDSGEENQAPLGRHVQMVFQESATALNPRMLVWKSVAEAATHGATVSGRQARDSAFSYLTRVGLSTAECVKTPGELSGGQRQRVGIARALASGAQVLVCDEAVSALDVSIRARILNLILRMKRDLQLTGVFISHDIGIVAHLADRLVVMNEGEVVESGRTKQVINSPTSEYTKALLAAVPKLER